MGPVIAPLVTDESVTFRLPDADLALTGTRLLPALSLNDGVTLEFARTDGEWRLDLARPPALRMEYKFQLRHPSGDFEEICDPGNPLRAPGAFGDKSVVEFPGYAAPKWLNANWVPGEAADVTATIRLWEPADAEPSEPLPLLVAHDGPEYDRLAALTGFSAALIAQGRLPRHRVAMLQPVHRDDEYSANPEHAALLHDTLLPSLRELIAVDRPVVGMGASLGGLAMLHAQRTYPGLFGGLFLQSASFLDTKLDPQEDGRFSKFAQVSAYTAEVLAGGADVEHVPVTMTCGTAEENLANNRQMAHALEAQGYPARLVETPDAHNYVSWRDAFDPQLADLLTTVWEG
jgi:enterochelin esterase family protein